MSETSSAQHIDTLTFTSKGFNSRHYIKLASDSTFVDEQRWASCLSGGGAQKIYGQYTSKNGKYTFSPKHVEQFDYIELADGNDITEVREFKYHKDSVLFEIPSNYHLVEWKQEQYLLSENNLFERYAIEHDFVKFAKFFNSESRGFKLDGHFLIHELETSDSEFPKFDFNQIPKKWRHYFLKEPLRATITDIVPLDHKDNDSDGQYWMVEINKGTDDLVYEGLYFSDKDSFIDITTDSISEHKSYGVVYLFSDENSNNAIGRQLRTKW